MPPIIDRVTADEIAGTCASIQDGVYSAMASSLLLTILIGFAMENLFSMIRQLTFLVIIGLIEIPYPGNILEYYKLVVNLSELDLLNGPSRY